MTTWMLLEDAPQIYEMLTTMFETWGIDGVAFVDGSSAVEWINKVDRGEVTGTLPELALLDWDVPFIKGSLVAKRIRESPRLKDVTIVMISAFKLNNEQIEEMLTQGKPDDYHQKPLPAVREFRAMLQTTIERRKAGQAAPLTIGEVLDRTASGLPTVLRNDPHNMPKVEGGRRRYPSIRNKS